MGGRRGAPPGSSIVGLTVASKSKAEFVALSVGHHDAGRRFLAGGFLVRLGAQRAPAQVRLEHMDCGSVHQVDCVQVVRLLEAMRLRKSVSEDGQSIRPGANLALSSDLELDSLRKPFAIQSNHQERVWKQTVVQFGLTNVSEAGVGHPNC